MAINRHTLRLLRKLSVTIGRDTDATTAALAKAWRSSWKDLHSTWREAVSDVVAKAAADGQWPKPWELARVERLRQAVLQSEEALYQLGRQAGITIRDGAGRIITTDAGYESQLIASQLPAAEQAAAAARYAANLTPTALNAIVARTQSRIVSSLKPLSGQASEAMRRELVKGIAIGSNPNRAASKMVARVQGAFNGGLVRARTIARTEMLDAYRATSAYAQAANADVVAGWIWHAQLDSRTCPSCWSQHGNVYPVTQAGPWDHQQGRCARLPKTKSWADLGITGVPEPDDDLVDAQAKFWSLPDGVQASIMGPGRLALLKSGQVQWGDLAGVRPSPEWRPSYGPRSVADLQRIAQSRAAQA